MILPWPPQSPFANGANRGRDATVVLEPSVGESAHGHQCVWRGCLWMFCFGVFGGIDVKNIWKLWLMYIKQHPNRMKTIYLTIVYIKYSYTLIVIWKLWLMYICVIFFVNPTKWQKKRYSFTGDPRIVEVLMWKTYNILTIVCGNL